MNRDVGDNALKLVGEAVLPGAAQMMAGNVKSGIAHAVLGVSAGAILVSTGIAPVLGTLAIIGIRLNSYVSSLTVAVPPAAAPLALPEPGAPTPPAGGDSVRVRGVGLRHRQPGTTVNDARGGVQVVDGDSDQTSASGDQTSAGSVDQSATGAADQVLARRSEQTLPTEAPAREPRGRRVIPVAIPDPDAPTGV